MLAAQALGKIADPAAKPALNARLEKGGDVFMRTYLLDAIKAIDAKDRDEKKAKTSRA